MAPPRNQDQVPAGESPSRVAQYSAARRRRRKALRHDTDKIAFIRARLGRSIEASADYMAPIVEKDNNNFPITMDEARRAAQEMGEMATEDLRVVAVDIKKLQTQDKKRKETSRGRKMPLEMKKRVDWAAKNVNAARKTFSVDDEDVRALLVEGYRAAIARKQGKGEMGAALREAGYGPKASPEVEAFVTLAYDEGDESQALFPAEQAALRFAQESLVEGYHRGMAQLRSAWTNLFYAGQMVKPEEIKLDAAATLLFEGWRERGLEKNAYTDQADKIAADRSTPAVVVNSDGVIVYSVWPRDISSTLRRSETKTPGRLRREWSFIRQAAGRVDTIKKSEMNQWEQDRVTEILRTEGAVPVNVLMSRIAVEQFMGRKMDADEWRDAEFLRPMVEEYLDTSLTPTQFRRVAVLMGEEGHLSPAQVLQKAGVRGSESRHSSGYGDLLERLDTDYANNPDEIAEHEMIWSLDI